MHLLSVLLQIAYFIVAFLVVCVGVFGISATKTERMVRAEELLPTRAFYSHTSHPQRIHETYKKLTIEQLWWTLLCGTIWPLGIPLYLAWKKGAFIDEALKKREELLHDPHSSG